MKKTIIIALLLGILPLAGCSQKGAENTGLGKQKVPANSISEPKESVSAPITESHREETASKSSSHTWHFANKAGYSYDLIINFWEPLSDTKSGGSIHPMNSKFLLGSECKFDPSSDLVIPGEITIKSSTKEFPLETNVQTIFRSMERDDRLNQERRAKYTGKGISPNDNDDRISIESFFSNSSKIDCESFSSTNNYDQLQRPLLGFKANVLKNEQSDSLPFFTIVHNYFSPSLPDGDKALLDWIVLRPFVENFKISGDDLRFWDSDISDDGRSLFSYSPVGMSLSGEVVKSDMEK